MLELGNLFFTFNISATHDSADSVGRLLVPVWDYDMGWIGCDSDTFNSFRYFTGGFPGYENVYMPLRKLF